MKQGKGPHAGGREDPLLKRIDEALAAWPAGAERVKPAEDALAVATSGKTPRSRRELSDEDVLGAPLPSSEEDGQVKLEVGSTSPAVTAPARERARTDFGELARFASRAGVAGARASAHQDEAEAERKENSGVIDLRAIAAGVVQREPAPDVRSAGRPNDVRSVAKQPRAAFDDATRRAARRRGAGWLALTAVVAGSVAAGGVFFGMKRAGHPAADSNMASVQRAAGGASAPATGAAVLAPTPRADDTRAVPVDPLGGAAPPLSVQASPSATGTGGAPARWSSSSPSAVSAARVERAATEHGVAGPATGRTDDSSLRALMQQAAGVTSTRSRIAGASTVEALETSGGSVPLRPALGAVQGAVGTTLPAARECMGADDPIARATITFRSDGSAQSVAVSGDAAGKPAEACIRSALLATRLPPFASPTFTWTTTVRPP